MTENQQPTHGWVAEKIGFSVAGVSLLRNGHRQPSMQTMEEIESAFGWSLHAQIDARKNYAEAFEKMLQEAWANSLEANPNREDEK